MDKRPQIATKREGVAGDGRKADLHVQAMLQIFNEEFEDLPKMNPTVVFHKPSRVKGGSNGSIQIHQTNDHWMVSHLENKQVFIYDSLNPATHQKN